MKRTLLTILAALAAAPLGAQQPAAAPAAEARSDAKVIVALVNGEVVTKEKLDQLYDRLGAQMRQQYEHNGGKLAFLDNYVKKRLVVQEAIKTGFDKRPDVQGEMEAAKESALFDRYVRDVISANIVTDDAIRKYYDEHKSDFATPERVKVRHIVITENGKTKEAALARIEQVAAELHQFRALPGTDPEVAKAALLNRFSQAARQYSEDASAEEGGDLGWADRGMFDPKFEEAAFNIKPGVLSGIVQTRFGYHLIFVEDHQPAGTETFEQARPAIREFLMTQNAANVMASVARLTNELRANSKITMYPENVK